jgi:hypothetical protein
MKQNEVVEILKHMSKYMFKHNWNYGTSEKDREALTEAIRCVELHNQLVVALIDATNIAECRGYDVKSARKLIKKAKGED